MNSFFEFTQQLSYIATICNDINTMIFWLNLKIIVMFLQMLFDYADLDLMYTWKLDSLMQTLIQDSKNVLLHVNNHFSILHQFFLNVPYTLNPPVMIMQENKYPLSEMALLMGYWNLFFLSGFLSFFLFMFLIWVFTKFHFEAIMLLMMTLSTYDEFGMEVTQYFNKGLTYEERELFFYYYCFFLILFISMLYMYMYVFWKNGRKFHSTMPYMFIFYFFMSNSYMILGRLLISTHFNLMVFYFSMMFLTCVVVLFYVSYMSGHLK